MNKKNARKYEKKNPRKAEILKTAVKKGVKQYEETFKRLAST